MTSTSCREAAEEVLLVEGELARQDLVEAAVRRHVAVAADRQLLALEAARMMSDLAA